MDKKYELENLVVLHYYYPDASLQVVEASNCDLEGLNISLESGSWSCEFLKDSFEKIPIGEGREYSQRFGGRNVACVIGVYDRTEVKHFESALINLGDALIGTFAFAGTEWRR